MLKLRFGKWHKAPIALPSVVVNLAQTLALRRQIFQIALANRETCAPSESGRQFSQTCRGLSRIAEPPCVKIHHFGEATALDQTLVIKGIVGGEKRGGMRKAVN